MKRNILFTATIIFLSFTLSQGDEFRISTNWYHYKQGMKMVAVKNWDQAQKEFNYYLNHPEMHRDMFGVAHFGRGLMFQEMGNYNIAIEEFKKAVQEDTHAEVKISDKAYMNIGTIYIKKNAYQDAIKAYSNAVEYNQRNGLAHYYLGLAYLKAGEFEKAEKEAEEAKKLGVAFTAIFDKLNEIKSKNKSDKIEKLK